jgi:hypothetical protein
MGNFMGIELTCLRCLICNCTSFASAIDGKFGKFEAREIVRCIILVTEHVIDYII